VESLILTANTAAPRRDDDPDAVQQGLLGLLDGAAAAAGVLRVELASVAETRGSVIEVRGP
jgi:hypothetical protein